MFRRVLFAAIRTTGALAGLAATPATAEAHPPIRRSVVCFEVLVRHRNHWDVYRTYHDRDDARRAARKLRFQGYDVKVRRA
jgi:predicted aminopeptidase